MILAVQGLAALIEGQRKAIETYARALGGYLDNDERARFEARRSEIVAQIESRRGTRVKSRTIG